MSEEVKSENLAIIIDGPVADWIISAPIESSLGNWQCDVARREAKGDGGDHVATIYGATADACKHRAELFCGDAFTADLMHGVYTAIADVLNRKRRLYRAPAELAAQSLTPNP